MITYKITDIEIYSKHNSRYTIEQCYVNPLIEQLDVWSKRILPIQKDIDTLRVIQELCNKLAFYHMHKHLLSN